MISVTAFSKFYAGQAAVSNLDFSVRGGQILGLVGPNGAGKSTTLSTLAGIMPPDSGTLLLDGHDILKSSIAAKRAVGYIPDEPPLFDDLSIWEHLVFIASAYGVDDLEEQGLRLLNAFSLNGREHTPCSNLSRGMRQKASVICAYLHNPPIYLFDEPMVGLDPAGIRVLHRSIQERADQGATVIVSSHMLSLVQDLCTHVLVLHEGIQRWYGPVRELKEGGASGLEDLFFAITEASVEGN